MSAASNLIQRLVSLLDSFNALYEEHSSGRCKSYEAYFSNGFPDEKTLIQPVIFPTFLKEILNFTNLDYVPEKRNKKNQAPDFTPMDTSLHNFIFETKGTDSAIADLSKEFRNKSSSYLEQDATLEMAVITNMRDVVVYSKRTNMSVEAISFSLLKLYQDWKRGIITKNQNAQRYLAFVDKFKRQDLTLEAKLQRIIDAPPHDEDYSKLHKKIQNEKILASIKYIVGRLKSDVSLQGIKVIEMALANDQPRKNFIIKEINRILKETSPSSNPQLLRDFQHLAKVSSTPAFRAAVDLFYYRAAYFAMTRLLLIRAWEDAHFIAPDDVTLYNGGLKFWYKNHNNNIERVLEHAYTIGKAKYEWLFKDDTNYSWYRPTKTTLIDVLYELAQYDLSELDRDILGTIYEQYLDRQDRKNKGQYYTPLKVVEFIWDRVGFCNDKAFFNWEKADRQPRLMYDCASGSGSFLVEAARRIREESRYDDKTLTDLLQIRNAVIRGIFGSEISAFAYYLSEVNLLLQLTPIIKKILALDHSQQRYQGKFTLGLIHENSLKMHGKDNLQLVNEDSNEKYRSVSSDQEYLIDKPESEKASVFASIKDGSEFDYCVANPPYIGESGHKELFRSTTNEIPYWKLFYQGKMDYLYWFVILALSKLRQGGKLGFITTSYWLRADGAEKLRRYILDNATIKEVIFFGQTKLFRDAKGQNSLIFILEKESNEEIRKKNRVKIVKSLTGTKGTNTTGDTIASLIEHIQKHIDKDNYKDNVIEVFKSPVKQGELNESPWFLANRVTEDKVILKMEKIGKPLHALFDINEGLVTGCNKIEERTLKKVVSEDIDKYSIKHGDGVFILNESEVNSLGLSAKELKIVRPFYKSSNIQPLWIDLNDAEYVLYLTKKTDENDIPNIILHLAGSDGNSKFKRILESRRECKEKKIPWYSLWWPREEHIFEGEKIVFPYRSPVSRFSFTDRPFYGASDMYFITYKNNSLLQPAQRLSLKYLLGILNSTLFRFWFKHRSNEKDGKRELFGNRMETFPVVEIDFEDKRQKTIHDKIVEIVDLLQDNIKELHALQQYFSDSIFDDRGMAKDPKTCSINPQSVILSLPTVGTRKARTSNSLNISINRQEIGFRIRDISNISFNLNVASSGFADHIVVYGTNKQTISIEGRKEYLALLRAILLNSFIGQNFKEVIDSVILPESIEDYDKLKDSIISRHYEIYKATTRGQKLLDENVTELYETDSVEIRL